MQRLTLSLLLVVISAVIGLGWGIDRWYSARFATEDPAFMAYKTLGSALALLTDELLDQAQEQPHEQTPLAIHQRLRQMPLQPQLVSARDFPLPGDVKAPFMAGEPLLLESGNQLSLHFYLPAHQQVLSLVLPEELHSDGQHSLRWLLTLLFYGGVVLIVLLWLYPLLQRLALLRKTAQAFGAGDLQARIAPDAKSYIHSIELEFNRMAQRIEQLIADNKLLSRGLSHDLRTPLARLRFGLDVLQEEQLTAAQQQNLAHLNRDLTAMEALVEALLHYARLEQANIAFSVQPIQLAIFITELRDNFYRGQVELFIAPAAQDYTVQADPEYLSMLLHNLVQNALRYGGGAVQIGMQLRAGQLHLHIEDDGPGIPAAERARVLQPFYRAEGGIQSSARGHGLGLAIVERIAQWHHLELRLDESARLGGLRVSLLWPAVP